MKFSKYVTRLVQLVFFASMILKSSVVFSSGNKPPSLAVYPAPANAVLNKDFTVRVRQNGEAWQTLPVHLVKIDQVRNAKHSTENASMCYFDFSGEVEVMVTYNKGNINQSRIRPLSYNIPHTAKGRTMQFRLYRPANLSVEVNGDIFHNLHLFANPIDEFKPDLRDTNLLYYGAGVHHIKGKVLKVPSGKTVYLAGGAILNAHILVKDDANVRVL